MCVCCMPEQCFIAMASDSKSHAIILCNKHEIEYWFLWVTHNDVFTSKYYIQILYNMMDIYLWMKSQHEVANELFAKE